MNIGIDFDNTITEHPRLFKKLTDSLNAGNVIYIISSCDRLKQQKLEKVYEEKEGMLRRWGIHYRKLMLALEPIPLNKARMCRKYKIDLMIDDDERNMRAIRKHAGRTACFEFLRPAGRGKR